MTTTTINLSDRTMLGISGDDFTNLLCHLTDQIAAKLGAYRTGATGYEHEEAREGLINTFKPEFTVRNWMAAAGERLDVKVVGCDLTPAS